MCRAWAALSDADVVSTLLLPGSKLPHTLITKLLLQADNEQGVRSEGINAVEQNNECLQLDDLVGNLLL